jgi:hypothetical protein
MYLRPSFISFFHCSILHVPTLHSASHANHRTNTPESPFMPLTWPPSSHSLYFIYVPTSAIDRGVWSYPKNIPEHRAHSALGSSCLETYTVGALGPGDTKGFSLGALVTWSLDSDKSGVCFLKKDSAGCATCEPKTRRQRRDGDMALLESIWLIGVRGHIGIEGNDNANQIKSSTRGRGAAPFTRLTWLHSVAPRHRTGP